MNPAFQHGLATSGRLSAVFFGAGILIVLYFISLHNYLLFHTLTELFSIAIGLSLFILTWNSRRILENNYLLFIGIAYLSASILDMFHTLSYRGIGIFATGGANTPTQLWIAARFVQSSSLFAASYFLKRRLNASGALFIFIMITGVLLASIFIWNIFPACYMEGVGLTTFKIVAEYIISILLLSSLVLLYKKRSYFDDLVLKLIAASILLTIGSELAFTYYINVYGLSNLIGHFLKIIAFYLIYKALIETSFVQPYKLLFRDLRRKQESLRESEERLEHALDTGKLGIWTVDMKSGKTWRSPRHAQIYGYDTPLPEWDRKTFLSHVITEDRAKIIEALRQAMSAGTIWSIEYRIRRADGAVRWIWAQGRPKLNDQKEVVQLVGIVRDITEQKLAEDESKSLARFPSENPYPVLRFNQEGKVMYANEASQAVLREWQCEMGSYAPTFWRDLIRNTLESRSQRIIDVDCAERSYSFAIAPITDAGYVNIYGRDITESKRSEIELKERTEQLENLNKELESFSYSVSHDLRAPLRAIDGYSRMILRNLAGSLDEDTKQKFGVIRSSAQMMGQLIDDLLTFSRLSRKDMATSKIDMDSLLRDAWKELQIINPGRNINLEINDIPYCHGDRLLIKQVCLNLLSNAVKFTKFQKVAHIEVGGHTNGNEIEYYVRDNGIGFDMAYYDKLFGVFQRLHSMEDFEGTGVGLANVQRIIHRHGGRVWAEGKIDQGACFYFTLLRKEQSF